MFTKRQPKSAKNAALLPSPESLAGIVAWHSEIRPKAGHRVVARGESGQAEMKAKNSPARPARWPTTYILFNRSASPFGSEDDHDSCSPLTLRWMSWVMKQFGPAGFLPTRVGRAPALPTRSPSGSDTSTSMRCDACKPWQAADRAAAAPGQRLSHGSHPGQQGGSGRARTPIAPPAGARIGKRLSARA